MGFVKRANIPITPENVINDKEELEKIASKTKKCPFCGKEVPVEAKTCPHCGKEIPENG